MLEKLAWFTNNSNEDIARAAINHASVLKEASLRKARTCPKMSVDSDGATPTGPRAFVEDSDVASSGFDGDEVDEHDDIEIRQYADDDIDGRGDEAVETNEDSDATRDEAGADKDDKRGNVDEGPYGDDEIDGHGDGNEYGGILVGSNVGTDHEDCHVEDLQHHNLTGQSPQPSHGPSTPVVDKMCATNLMNQSIPSDSAQQEASRHSTTSQTVPGGNGETIRSRPQDMMINFTPYSDRSVIDAALESLKTPNKLFPRCRRSGILGDVEQSLFAIQNEQRRAVAQDSLFNIQEKLIQMQEQNSISDALKTTIRKDTLNLKRILKQR
ncbi:hypothetical protein IWX90DRAFT_410837 [Phyllosticta citrichinensis]|uniref:Uncharacterized protein n=1 Tax=Phyllosticta citrichinensis TaxID=1130410 RepID=A0ABR1Y653_9PEZI